LSDEQSRLERSCSNGTLGLLQLEGRLCYRQDGYGRYAARASYPRGILQNPSMHFGPAGGAEQRYMQGGQTAFTESMLFSTLA
jgi:hypothetical protein